MVEVVVPHRVEATPALVERTDELRLLGLGLGEDEDRAFARGRARARADLAEDVDGGCIMDALRRVEAEAVEMELVDPVGSVRGEVLARAA